MSIYNFKELKDGEIFLGNHNVTKGLQLEDNLKTLKTIRLGEQAFDLHGHKIDRDYYRPVFIHQSEVAAYDKIKMAELAEIRRS